MNFFEKEQGRECVQIAEASERRSEKPISRCRLQLEEKTPQLCLLSRLLGEKRTGFVGITHHHCHAMGSHHMESNKGIVIYVRSDITIQWEERCGPSSTFGVIPSSMSGEYRTTSSKHMESNSMLIIYAMSGNTSRSS